MGTYENFYLNQIKQLQEENKKLKQIIDEGILSGNIVSAAALKSTKLPRRPQPGYGPSSDSPAPVVPGRSDPEGYASDDMESRRTRPGYGISSDSQGAGPKGDWMTRMVDEKIRRAREGRGFDYRF